MLKLLKLEYYKNLNYRPFKIFTILYFAILIAMLFIGLFDFEFLGNSINLKQQGMYNFPGIWNFTTWVVGLLKIFLGLIIVFSICQEFSNRMFKQNTIDGLSREDFIGSKLLTIFIFSLISTIVVFIITLFLGETYSNVTDSESVLKEISFIGNYFVKLFTFFCFLMFLSIVLRRSMFVFLVFFILWVGESILQTIERRVVADGLIGTELKAKLHDHFFITKLLPLESISGLIPNPMVRLDAAKLLGVQYEFAYPTENLIACIIWSGIFIVGSYLILKKRDW